MKIKELLTQLKQDNINHEELLSELITELEENDISDELDAEVNTVLDSIIQNNSH